MKPYYSIIYEGKDVSRDFAPILESIHFTEHLENKAAELELVFINAAAYFFGDWYPSTDDNIKAKLGYENNPLIDCGSFFVDDVSLSGSRQGDVCSFRAMSARGSSIYSDQYRQNREGKAISEIVNEIAGRLGYSAKGDLSGNWSGIQTGTGLKFLEKLAKETGRMMKVEGSDLYFIKLGEVKSSPVVGTVNRADVGDYLLTDKATGRIGKCTVKCWDKDKKELIEGVYDANIDGGGSITLWADVEDQAAAEARAKHELEDRNKRGVQFELSVPGDVKYRAGVRVKTSGFGIFDKTWYVATAKHSINRTGGYTTRITVQE